MFSPELITPTLSTLSDVFVDYVVNNILTELCVSCEDEINLYMEFVEEVPIDDLDYDLILYDI